MSKQLKSHIALALLLVVSLQAGCSQNGPVAQIIKTVISLAGVDLGGFGMPTGGFGGGGPTSPGGGFGGIFGGNSAPPASPWGGQPTQPLSVTGKEAYKELTEKYRWSLSGAYGDADLEKALWVARQFKTEEITTVSVRWTGGGGGGTAGLYSWGSGGTPRVTMYSRSCKVLCHEISHHFSITHHTQRQRAVVQEFLKNTWSGRPLSRSDIPTNYSLTNHKEWMAECGSIYRMKMKGRHGFNHWSSWNPSQQFRSAIDKWYVD